MTQELVSVSLMPSTRSLVNCIAKTTHEKKFSIYDRAIREYAKKLGLAAGN